MEQFLACVWIQRFSASKYLCVWVKSQERMVCDAGSFMEVTGNNLLTSSPSPVVLGLWPLPTIFAYNSLCNRNVHYHSLQPWRWLLHDTMQSVFPGPFVQSYRHLLSGEARSWWDTSACRNVFAKCIRCSFFSRTSFRGTKGRGRIATSEWMEE